MEAGEEGQRHRWDVRTQVVRSRKIRLSPTFGGNVAHQVDEAGVDNRQAREQPARSWITRPVLRAEDCRRVIWR